MKRSQVKGVATERPSEWNHEFQKSDASDAQERLQRIKEALQGSKIEIVDLRANDTDRVRAKSNVSDT